MKIFTFLWSADRVRDRCDIWKIPSKYLSGALNEWYLEIESLLQLVVLQSSYWQSPTGRDRETDRDIINHHQQKLGLHFQHVSVVKGNSSKTYLDSIHSSLKAPVMKLM